jgi:hypothetical protein
VANGIPLGCSLFLPVVIVIGVQTLKVLLFEAHNSSLRAFAPPIELYGTHHSFVSNNSVSMFECPDVFQLSDGSDASKGEQYAVLTSAEADGNQWMVGTIAFTRTDSAAAAAAAPKFSPTTGGYTDQGTVDQFLLDVNVLQFLFPLV